MSIIDKNLENAEKMEDLVGQLTKETKSFEQRRQKLMHSVKTLNTVIDKQIRHTKNFIKKLEDL